MKNKTKYFLLLAIAIVLSNCDVSPRKANADTLLNIKGSSTVECRYITINGMNYMITGTFYGGSTVTNLTKDYLECEYYKKELKK